MRGLMSMRGKSVFVDSVRGDEIMAASKGPVYKEKNVLGDPELFRQLSEAVIELEEKMKATLPITRGSDSSGNYQEIGFGVNKAQRGIAVDQIVSIVRAIRNLRGW